LSEIENKYDFIDSTATLLHKADLKSLYALFGIDIGHYPVMGDRVVGEVVAEALVKD
jgi:hypothetical protein